MTDLVSQNFTMRSGDDKTLTVTVKDDDDVAVSIASAQSIKWQLRDSVGGTLRVSKTLDSGIAITDGAAGIFTVTIDAADTASIAGRYYQEAEVVNSAGKKQTVLVGWVTIKQDAIT